MVRLIIKQVHLSQDGCCSGASFVTVDGINAQLEAALSGNPYMITTVAGLNYVRHPEGLTVLRLEAGWTSEKPTAAGFWWWRQSDRVAICTSSK